MCYVDLATARLSLSAVDFDLPGRLPLVFKRHYRSTNMWRGDLGYGWSHPFGVTLRREKNGGLMFRGADGRRFPFAVPGRKEPVQQPTEQISMHFFEAEDLPWDALRSDLNYGAFVVQSGREPTLIFDARPIGDELPWRAIANRSENLVLIQPGADGLPAQITDANGRIVYLFRNRGGSLAEIHLADSKPGASPAMLVRYEYDWNEDLTGVFDSAGARTYKYSDHLLVEHQDRRGGACHSVYDKQGRCHRTSGPGGVTARSYEFDTEHRTTLERDSFGNVSLYTYSPTQRIVQTVDPAGGVSNFFYDAKDRLVVAADQMGHETMICYAQDGSPRGKVRPNGSVIGMETDSLGELIGVTTPGGVQLHVQRDELGRVIEVTYPAGDKCLFAYGANGDITKIKLSSGREASLTWSPDGRGVTESDQQGVLTEQQFDLFSRLGLFRDAVGATTRYRYDDAGHLSEIVYPDDSHRRFVYDAEGRLTSVQDENGDTTRWNFDIVGRCIGVSLPIGQELTYQYDSENRLIAAQGTDGLWHRFFYDGRGLLTSQQFSDGRIEQYESDPRGLLVKMTDSSGAVVDVERDEIGSIRRIAYPDGTEKIITNDRGGRWARVEWNGHVLERELNDKAQITTEQQDDFVLKRKFNENGRVLAVTASTGSTIQFQYDPNDRIASLQTSGGAEPRDHRFAYDRVGNLVEWAMPSGKIERRKYDLRGRLVEQVISLNEKIILQRRYSYDPLGRLRVLDDSLGGRREYRYDPMGRLLSCRGGASGSGEYSYSAAGDLLDGALEYAAGHRVTRTRSSQLEYDARGFVVGRTSAQGKDHFFYLFNGLMQEARLADGKTIRYEYDPHYRLVKRVLDGRETRYCWGGEQVWFLQEQGGEPMEFLYLPGAYTPLEQRVGDRYYSVHTDHCHKIQELIDDDGVVVWRNDSDVWGVMSQRAPSPAGVLNPFVLPGQIRDAHTGFAYNRNRFYYPEAAHYLSPDPIGLWAGMDQYLYPSDPVNFIDPDALKCRGKTDDPTLYRGDKRPPSEVCSQGFTPRDPSAGLSLLTHVNGVPDTGSNWISTTHDFGTAEKSFASAGAVYAIKNPGCGVEVDCDPEIIQFMKDVWKDPNPLDSKSTEHEIAFDKAIPPGNVTGYYPVQPGGGLGPFTAC